MKSEIRFVTPAWARDILERFNTKNRPLAQRRVAQLAADMKAGCFLLTHQGIAFDEDGVLLDGQHRLAAVVMAGIPVQMMVTTGIPRQIHVNDMEFEVMDVLDVGGRRPVGQQLTLSHGIADGHRIAAVVVTIAEIAMASESIRLTTAQTVRIYNMYIEGIKSIMALPWMVGKRKASLQGTLAFCYFSKTQDTMEFSTLLSSMTNIPTGSPAAAFLRWEDRNGRAANATARMQYCKVLMSALYRFSLGHSATKLYASEEGFDAMRLLQKEKVAEVRRIVTSETVPTE